MDIADLLIIKRKMGYKKSKDFLKEIPMSNTTFYGYKNTKINGEPKQLSKRFEKIIERMWDEFQTKEKEKLKTALKDLEKSKINFKKTLNEFNNKNNR